MADTLEPFPGVTVAPDDDPDFYGECVLQSDCDWPDRHQHVRITRADPRILIDASVLFAIIANRSPIATYRDGVVTIRAENRTVVYRVGRYLPRWGCYEAEWPD